jgi:hypothetical protein
MICGRSRLGEILGPDLLNSKTSEPAVVWAYGSEMDESNFISVWIRIFVRQEGASSAAGAGTWIL